MTKSHSKVGQNTTHPCLYIRNIDDALKVLEAARSNVLPLIRHRLCAQERAQLKSGNVFVWEESSRDCPEGGLVRWTEGRKWSQSRFRRDCFIYKEKLGFVGKTKSQRNTSMSSRRKTYSTVLCMPGSSVARKWHLVAYFSDCDKDRLPVIENYEYLKYIQVPPGVFLTTHKLSCSPQSIQSPHHSHDIDQKTYMKANRPSLPCLPLILPPISSLIHPSLRSPGSVESIKPRYTPLMPEDRRILNSFRFEATSSDPFR
ncbi:Gti1/Pac2 family-domain-containing protein [Mycena rebaudengoi]|nr:Gti1/Pac2 family-domain-containing protein [Mycena rebaudengoi]